MSDVVAEEACTSPTTDPAQPCMFHYSIIEQFHILLFIFIFFKYPQ